VSDDDLDEAPLDRHGWVAEQPEHCGPQADGSFVLALEHEIQLGQSGDPTTELRFRQPKGKDWMSFPTDPKEVGDLLRMAARLTGRPLAELQQLEGVDVRRVRSGGFSHGRFARADRERAHGRLALDLGWPPDAILELTDDELAYWLKVVGRAAKEAKHTWQGRRSRS